MALLALGLVLLLVHTRLYAFLTDDAYISFRYARNLSHGFGLVFNPGMERVEGYSNLLWVLVLAAFDRFGLRPERVANPLSVLCTIVLWGVIAWYAWKRRRETAAWCLGAALVWLGVTRSIAVWSTSGLETRSFELWVVWGVLRLASEIEAAEAGRPWRPFAAPLFALGALTRPDGLLIGASACAAGALWLLLRRRDALLRYIVSWTSFALLVGAQLAFRRAYYGEWVPNTYFAKVGGHTDVRLGLEYLWAFVLEYAAYLWLPLLALGAWRLIRARAPLPALLAAVLVPYLAYVVAIGGDHFEFRPLDLVFPLAFVLMAEGLRSLVASRARAAGAAAFALVIAIGLFVRPWQTHVETPAGYYPGFPGHPGYETGVAREFLAPAHDGIYRLPGLAAIAAEHRRLLFALTYRFACIRQEEHVGFLASSMAEGERIRQLIADGRLPRDVYIAMSVRRRDAVPVGCCARSIATD
jgi:arabinofuranosyltransferase